MVFSASHRRLHCPQELAMQRLRRFLWRVAAVGTAPAVVDRAAAAAAAALAVHPTALLPPSLPLRRFRQGSTGCRERLLHSPPVNQQRLQRLFLWVGKMISVSGDMTGFYRVLSARRDRWKVRTSTILSAMSRTRFARRILLRAIHYLRLGDFGAPLCKFTIPSDTTGGE